LKRRDSRGVSDLDTLNFKKYIVETSRFQRALRSRHIKLFCCCWANHLQNNLRNNYIERKKVLKIHCRKKQKRNGRQSREQLDSDIIWKHCTWSTR
jgi:hypothetical protein